MMLDATWSRLCLVGGPRTGKSSLADALGGEPGVKLYRTDDLNALRSQ